MSNPIATDTASETAFLTHTGAATCHAHDGAVVDPKASVSVVVPVYNGARTLTEALEALLAQDVPAALEIIVVDDGSTDGSVAIASAIASRDPRVRCVAGAGRGAAAAINLGIRKATHPLIAQLDQDMVPRLDWLRNLLAHLRGDDRLAAVQGRFATDPDDNVWTRVTAVDLAQRYQRLDAVAAADPSAVDQVCTGCTLYRRPAIEAVGRFDESMGYGYDNNLSYRLVAAGWRLSHCPAAICVHRATPSLRSYLVQQYGLGYGRLDLVRRHPRRVTGDQVSGIAMIIHAAAMTSALLLATSSLGLLALGLPSRANSVAAAVLGICFSLATERFVASLRAWWRFKDVAAWFFVPLHLLRDLCWGIAVVRWAARCVLRAPSAAKHSMGRARP